MASSKVTSPLEKTHIPRGAEDQAALFDGTRRRNPHQCFAGATGKHDNPRASTPVTKHLAQAFLLIGPNDGDGLQVYVKVGIAEVISEVVFLQHGEVKFDTPFF